MKLYGLIHTQIIPLSLKENDYLHSDLDLVQYTLESLCQQWSQLRLWYFNDIFMTFPTCKSGQMQLHTGIHESSTVKSTFLPLQTASVLGEDAHTAKKSLCSTVSILINPQISQRNITERLITLEQGAHISVESTFRLPRIQRWSSTWEKVVTNFSHPAICSRHFLAATLS